MDTKTREKMSVDRAKEITFARSDYHLSQLLGVTRQLVSLWRKRGFIGFKYPETCRIIGRARRGRAA